MNVRVTRLGAWLAAAMLATAGCSSDSSGGPEERIVVADGTTLRLMKVVDHALVEVDSAAVPTEGLLAGHSIFGVIQHPTKPWLYVTSFNECGAAIDWCWGNARVDRFTVSKGGIDWAGLVYAYDVNATPACAGEDATSTNPTQVGFCAPVNGGFSADGTRLYLKEDDNDTLDVFAVAPNGALTFLAENASIDLHGIAAHPTLSYLYNGTHVLDVDSDAPVNVTTGTGGNDTWFIEGGEGDDLLVTTLSNTTVAFYSLADPAVPALVSQVVVGSNKARALDFTADHSRLVAVGRNSVTTLGFDGATLSTLDSVDLSGSANIENRSVTLVDGGAMAVVSWFLFTNGAPSGNIGGVYLYGIDAATGVLTQQDFQVFANGARAVVALTVD